MMDQSEQKIKVFVSYKRLDKEFVIKLTEALSKEGFEVWIDWDDIPTGEDWRKEIAEGLQNCHAFVFVISPASVASKEVRYEIDMAIQHKKRILPVMYIDEDGIWGRMPSEVAKINAVNMRTDEEYAANLTALLTSLRVDFQHVRKHTKLQQRAIEWDTGGRRSSVLLHGDALTSVEAWMIEAANKDPVPTKLQGEYVNASRKDETRRQRVTLISVSVGLAIAIVLAVLALFQWQAAETAKAEALNNLDRAVVAEKLAQSEKQIAEQNAELARAAEAEARFQEGLAQAAEAKAIQEAERAVAAEQDAVNQRDNAIKQQQLAFARRLGAEGLSALQSSEIERSLLLSINSLRTVANPQADLALRTGLDLLPRSVAVLPGAPPVTGSDSGTESDSAAVSGANPAIYSPDGSLLFTSNAAGGIAIWSTAKYLRPTTLDQGSRVIALAQHPTKPWLAAAGADGSLKIWDTTTGLVIHTYENPSPVTLMAFNPTGLSLVTAGIDKQVRIWSTSQPTQLFAITHLGKVTHLAFSRNGSYLASSASDGVIFFYDISSRRSLLTLSSNSAITALSFHPTNLVILTGNADGLVQAWDMITGREFRRMSHETTITDALISPGADLYITASEDSTIRIWSTATGQIIKTFNHNAPVRDIAIDASGRYLASTSDDGTVRIWDLHLLAEIARSPIMARRVIFSPFGTNVAVMDTSGKVNIFDYTSAQQAILTLDIEEAPTSLAGAFLPDRSVVVVASGGGVTLWNYAVPATGGENLQSGFQIGAQVLDVALANQGDLLATGDSLGRVCLWEMASGSQVGCVPLGAPVHDVDFSPDDAWLAAGGEQASVIEAATGTILYQVPLAPGSPEGAVITSVSLDQEGKRLAVATNLDSIAHFWNLETGQLIFQTAAQFGLNSPANLVEYIPSKNWVVSNQGQNIFIWDASTGSLVNRFFNTSEVSALAVSADGSRLAIAGEDFNAYVWDLQSGSEIARIPHLSPVVDLIFHSDGTRLITAAQDGLVQVSSLQNDSLMTEACRRLTRNLSFNEWMLFLGGDIPYARTCEALSLGAGVRDALFAQAFDQAQAGQAAAAESTLEILAAETGLREQFLSVVASQVQSDLANQNLERALAFSSFLVATPEAAAESGFTGSSALADVCRAAAGVFPEQALGPCDHAVRVFPEDTSLLAARGEALARTGDLAKALADFEAALAKAPANTDPALIAARQKILDALKAGENPFTP